MVSFPKIIFQGFFFINLDQSLRSQISKEFDFFKVNRLNAQDNTKHVK